MDPPEKFGDPLKKRTPSSPTSSPPSAVGRERENAEGDQPQAVEVCTGIPLASTTMPVTLSHVDPYVHFSQKTSSPTKPKEMADGSFSRGSNGNSKAGFVEEMEANNGVAGEMLVDPNDKFSSRLWDCMTDTQSSADNLLCCYCNLSSQANMVLNSKRGIHWPLCLGMLFVDYFCCAGVCSCVSFCAVNILVRHSLRQRYHLSDGVEEMVKDIAAGSCCAPCALCQQHREMSKRGEWPGCVLFGLDPAAVVVTHVNIA